jgi:mannose-6-phosphate isomerase-like protein (cupin superfamily)
MENLLVSKPWGNYRVVSEGEFYKAKILLVAPLQAISYQFHKERNEEWLVLKGIGQFRHKGITKPLFPGDTVFIEVLESHQLSNPSETENLIIFEVQRPVIGGICSEDDLSRLEDPNWSRRSLRPS